MPIKPTKIANHADNESCSFKNINANIAVKVQVSEQSLFIKKVKKLFFFMVLLRMKERI